MQTQHWTRGLKAAGLGLVTLMGTASAQEAAVDVPGPIDSLQDLQDSGRMLFKSIDANNDGQISQQEAIDAANVAVGGFFFTADLDGNGTLSKEEAQQARDKVLAAKPMARFLISRVKSATPPPAGGSPNPAAAFMSVVDANGDGQLQATEVRQAVQTAVQGLFAAADTNRDGQMSPVEVNAAIAGAVKAAGQASFQAADADNNGQLSRQEFDKAIIDPANAVFAVLDANGDGQLSPQELQSAQKIIGQQIQRSILPEAPNSARNLIQSGQKPAQVAPVPTFNPNAPAATTAPAPR
ncbi:EF-hand domain-containing protein [Tundrisphaera sp. TA3]|uniref:EF-hand domain-containing protein n=1 Tax=Tundrisphaera sp. TA3 TaxID=3435775 RepID=UPI003EBE8AEA